MTTRRLIGNRYVIEDLSWIKEQICKISGTTIDRKLHVTIDKSSYGDTGYIFFSLEGSPPKGCAVYAHGRRFIVFINSEGKTKKYNDTYLDIDNLNKLRTLYSLEKND